MYHWDKNRSNLSLDIMLMTLLPNYQLRPRPYNIHNGTAMGLYDRCSHEGNTPRQVPLEKASQLNPTLTSKNVNANIKVLSDIHIVKKMINDHTYETSGTKLSLTLTCVTSTKTHTTYGSMACREKVNQQMKNRETEGKR